MAAGGEEGDRVRIKGLQEEQTMSVALVGGEGRIVETPIREIVGSGVSIPVLRRGVEGDLHPMPLRFKIPIHGRIPSPRIRMQRHQNSHQKRKESYNHHR